MTLPIGYSAIPGGTFTPDCAKAPVTVAPFDMKQTPVTNAEYDAIAQSLGTRLARDNYLLLDYDFESGETRLVRRGRTAAEVAGGPAMTSRLLDFDRGDVIIFGSQILLKMQDNISAQYDEADRLFSGATQPVVGVSYFHAKAWCLLKSLEDGGKYRYALPTDEQYEYVASEGGTKECGTRTGSLYSAGGRKLAHIDEYNGGKGTTVEVNDLYYEQRLPFDVQTTGNVFRWIQMNPAFKTPHDHFSFAYGLRGGSWTSDAYSARASLRYLQGDPVDRFNYAGFQPWSFPRTPG